VASERGDARLGDLLVLGFRTAYRACYLLPSGVGFSIMAVVLALGYWAPAAFTTNSILPGAADRRLARDRDRSGSVIQRGRSDGV
jgi:hypothetical protein